MEGGYRTHHHAIINISIAVMKYVTKKKRFKHASIIKLLTRFELHIYFITTRTELSFVTYKKGTQLNVEKIRILPK